METDAGQVKERQITSRQGAALCMVLGPLIAISGLPSLNGRIYPDWLPVDEIGIALIVVGTVLFIIGATHLIASLVKALTLGPANGGRRA
ncbi:MAG: hypothetical protein R3B57_01290 [Phycisphaerales bacterium]